MNSENTCRTCLKITDKLMPLFQTPLLVFKIVAIAPVEIFSNDNLPQTICAECCENIDKFFNFKEMIINNHAVLKRRYTESAEQDLSKNNSGGNSVQSVGTKSEILKKVGTQQLSDSLADGVDITADKKGSSSEMTNTPEERILCNKCGEHIIGHDNLHRHARLYCQNPVNCHKCGETLINYHFLKAHLRMVHEKISHCCEQCRTSFAAFTDYQSHIANCNPKKKTKFEIGAQQNSNDCRQQEATSSNSSFEEYNREPLRSSECEQTKDTYICKICRMSCHSRKHLYKHTKRQHADGISKFCPYCSEALPSKEALKGHMLFHRSFACPHCTRNFNYEVALQAHIKSKHKDNVQSAKK